MIVAHGRRLVDVLIHCQLGIEINAQVSNSSGRLNCTGADLERPLIGLQPQYGALACDILIRGRPLSTIPML